MRHRPGAPHAAPAGHVEAEVGKDYGRLLQLYAVHKAQIEARKKTGLTESKQRQLARAIKRARHIALLPFVTNG